MVRYFSIGVKKIDIKEIIKIAEDGNCKVLTDEKLSRYTTFKIGGECKALIKISNKETLKVLIKKCNEDKIKYIVIGNGSNLLVDDDGYNGVVFSLGNDFADIKLIDDQTIECYAGMKLSALCKFALENSLTGLEFAYGIPGSIGGGIYMNAGAYGGEIKDVIVSCESIDKNGKIITRNAKELLMSYRHSIFSENKEVIINGTFRLQKGVKSEIKAKMDELINRRVTKQPLEYPSAGSTFKRPEGSYASMLIEKCGLKGFTVGGACVSEKHSGFIINKNNATFKDVITLINKVKEIVFEKTGYKLECELEIISNKQ